MIEIPIEARILVIEGIAGAGKTTFKTMLKNQYKAKNIFEFIEEETLLGWRHIHIPHVSALRMNFFSIFLDYIEQKLVEEPDALFIFERFHLSTKILEWEFENNFTEKFDSLVERLRQLPIHTVIITLNQEQIRNRMRHRDRSRQWDNFINEKLKLRGFSDLELLSIDQQNQFLNLAAELRLPYSTFTVDRKDIIRVVSQKYIEKNNQLNDFSKRTTKKK